MRCPKEKLTYRVIARHEVPWQSMLTLFPCHCEEGLKLVCVEDTSSVAVKMRVADNLYSSTASGPPSPLFEKEERRLKVTFA